MKLRAVILCLGLSGSIFGNQITLYAQDSEPESTSGVMYGFIEVGTTLPFAEDLVYGAGLQYLVKRNSLTFRVSVINDAGFSLVNYKPIEKLYDIGLLYGLVLIDLQGIKIEDGNIEIVQLTAHAGISFINMIERGELLYSRNGGYLGGNRYEKLSSQTIGLPYTLSVSFGARKSSVKFSYIGNINTLSSYHGLTAGFFVGFN